LATPAWSAAKPNWKAFAACAAAYRVNAAVKDVSRPAEMKAQIFETSDDYEKAAVAKFRSGVNDNETAAKSAVSAYIQTQVPALTRRSREQVERLIDACPQTEE